MKRYPNLKTWRMHQLMRSQDAAVKLGVSKATYSKYELKGIRRLDVAQRVSEQTGVPLLNILTGA